MTPTQSLSERPEVAKLNSAPTASETLRGWSTAYRETPEHRFPSDPNAEFFPQDLDFAADALDAKDEEIKRLHKLAEARLRAIQEYHNEIERLKEGRRLREVDAIMQTIPAEWRNRWCGGEHGACACMGCVQIGNRLIMAGLRVTQVDPEYIDETKIPADVYKRYKITKEEWVEWMRQQEQP